MILIYAFKRTEKLIKGARKNRVLDGDGGVDAALVVEVDLVDAKEITTDASIRA